MRTVRTRTLALPALGLGFAEFFLGFLMADESMVPQAFTFDATAPSV